MEWLRSAQVFECVVQSASFSEAGRRLGCSPATISRHINDLEEHLKVRLVNRTSRHLSLTEAGEVYSNQLLRILADIRQANGMVADLHGTPTGLLRVHSRMVIGHQFIVPILHRFHARYPQIQVELELSNYPADLVAKGIDIDIRMGRLTDSSLVVRKLLPSERLLCASPAYLDRAPPITSPEDLRAHSCLNYRIHQAPPMWRLRTRDGQETVVPVTGAFHSNSGLALLQATLDDMGISIMNDWTVRDHLAQGRLRRVLPGYEVTFSDFENGIYAVFQRSSGVPSKIRHFLDFLVAEFKALKMQAGAE
ncbi:LysR family transcriptional regulator [Xinfangfangia pollutisoli]|uniref:LysR family transcriptional regulator n=1 Tax=Xinfangfangia pollutisoli TaxID=2865960 RepID=UPI001CD650AD|nr:LysR family transcriptional regulator [Xinfangfangia pollutisoli]